MGKDYSSLRVRSQKLSALQHLDQYEFKSPRKLREKADNIPTVQPEKDFYIKLEKLEDEADSSSDSADSLDLCNVAKEPELEERKEPAQLPEEEKQGAPNDVAEPMEPVAFVLNERKYHSELLDDFSLLMFTATVEEEA